MQFIVKLTFTSPLHISKGKPDYLAESETVLHSDTIKSAIFTTGKILFNENECDKDFWESFIVSSAMPFYKEHLFLPKPNLNNIDFSIKDNDKGKTVDSDNLILRKKIKKTKFIELSVFDEFNEGKQLQFEDYQFAGGMLWDKETIEEFLKANFSDDENKNEELKNEFETLSEEQKTIIIKKYHSKIFIYKKGQQERVKIYSIPEKENNKWIFSRPFTIERLYFHRDAGLYFIVNANNEDVKNKIIKILDTLKDVGFGTDKAVGNGQFEFEIVDMFNFRQPEYSRFKMNLSLYLPNKLERKNYVRYNLIERGGYISGIVDEHYSGTIRKTINMFDVGSIFLTEMNDMGKYVDLKPEGKELNHPVWREGRSIFIPINFKTKDK